MPSSVSRLVVTCIVLAITRLALRRYLVIHPLAPLHSLPYLLAGLTFSLGLLMSGMVSPLKVISFLRLLPPWQHFDPSLAMIVLGGVLPNLIHYQSLKPISPNSGPNYPWESWRIPQRKDIDWKLTIGSAIFGIGWGLCGVCPGPVLVNLSQTFVDLVMGKAHIATLLGVGSFISAMIMGMKVGRSV